MAIDRIEIVMPTGRATGGAGRDGKPCVPPLRTTQRPVPST